MSTGARLSILRVLGGDGQVDSQFCEFWVVTAGETVKFASPVFGQSSPPSRAPRLAHPAQTDRSVRARPRGRRCLNDPAAGACTNPARGNRKHHPSGARPKADPRVSRGDHRRSGAARSAELNLMLAMGPLNRVQGQVAHPEVDRDLRHTRSMRDVRIASRRRRCMDSDEVGKCRY